MGNYCCDKEEPKEVVSRKVCKKESQASTQDPSQARKEYEKQIISLLKSRKDVNTSPTCPYITGIEVAGDLGKGGQAEIYEVYVETAIQGLSDECGFDEQPLALKRIEKPNSSYKASSLALGSQLLLQNKCPFLIEGLLCCQNQQFMYELMKIAEGGDLSTFLETTVGKGDSFRKLGQQGIKMVLAGVVLGLQYMHHHGFIYCDLKIENVLIGKDGYPRLADFDLAARQATIPSEKYQSTMTSVGPQIFLQDFVDRGMDLWALGIFVFTLLYGEPPYTKEDIKDGSFIRECQRKQDKYGLKRKKASPEILSLINSLLKFKAHDRLGYKSISEIKKHEFFKGFNWDKYSRKELESPLAEIVIRYSKQKRQSQKFKVKKYRSMQCEISPIKGVTFQASPIKISSNRKTKCDMEQNSSIEN